MDRETAVAQLCIVDGTWQEAPDSLAVVQDLGRGVLYLLTEVQGEAEGRDELARELIETARREYIAHRGSVAHALTLAIQAANECFYNYNANAVPEARRIAGLTAVVQREDELFVTQAGPGLTCVVRGAQLLRFPEDSPWYDQGANDNFRTPGTYPLGMRKEYHPDFFHITLTPGDIILVATQSLVHLLTREELVDTLKCRQPDTIIDNLEDVAGTTTLSAIAIRIAGEDDPDMTAGIEPEPLVESEAPPFDEQDLIVNTEPAPEPLDDQEEESPLAAPSEGWASVANTGKKLGNQLYREIEQEQGEEQIEQARSIAVAETLRRNAAGFWGRIDWSWAGRASRRSLNFLVRALVMLTRLSARAFLPEDSGGTERSNRPFGITAAKIWRVVALVFPVVLLLAGGGAWVTVRVGLQQRQATQVSDLLDQSTRSIDQAKKLASTDKAGATAAYKNAILFSQQALKLNPNNANARAALYQAEDLLDDLNGISVVSPLSSFATFSDPKSIPGRVVAHIPYVFVFDRGTQRIYRYVANDSASTIAPYGNDRGGVILQKDDQIGERVVGEIIDIFWVDSGKLVALDRTGQFLSYDPIKAGWAARSAPDGTQWASVKIASSYVGNVYVLDPSKNQIVKYVPTAEGIWGSASSYFASGVNVDLSSAVDIAVDGDLWVLRADGSIWRFINGRLADFALDAPVSRPVALATTQTMVGLYIADAGNQRIVQYDKVTGKYMRQYKPRTEVRDWFNALKSMAADETSKKFFLINGNQVYMGSIPQ